MKSGFTYIISNKNRTVLYIGVTSNIYQRVREHKLGLGSNFTKKYNVVDLLFYEDFGDITEAIVYEKRLKNWKRDWKMNLIKNKNPLLVDLSADWFDEGMNLKEDFIEW